MDQESRSGWLGVSHGVVVKLSARAAGIWDWRIHFQAHWRGCQQASVPGWLVVRGLSSYSHEGHHRLPKGPHDMASGFLQSKWERGKEVGGRGEERERERETGRENNIFVTSFQKLHTLTSNLFCSLEPSHKAQPEILSHLFLDWCPSPVLLPFKKPFLPSFFEVLWHRSLYPPQLLLQYWIHKRYVIRNDLSVNTNIWQKKYLH